MPFFFILFFYFVFPFKTVWEKMSLSHIVFLVPSLLLKSTTPTSTEHHLGGLTTVDGSMKLLFHVVCVLDVFMYCLPHIDVDRSSMIKNGSFLHNLQKVSLPLSHKHFSHPAKDFTFFIAAKVKMISPSVIYPPFFSTTKQLCGPQPWMHIKITWGTLKNSHAQSLSSCIRSESQGGALVLVFL